MVLSASLDATAALWDPRAGSAAALTLAARAPLRCAAAAAAAEGGGGGGAQLVAAGTRCGGVFVWDLRRGAAPLFECAGHDDEVTALAFAFGAAPRGWGGGWGGGGGGGGLLLLSASRDWTARAWDMGGGGGGGDSGGGGGGGGGGGACRGVLVGHAGAVTALSAFRCTPPAPGAPPGALRVATGCEDGSVGVWEPGGGLCTLACAHAAPVRVVAAGAGGLVTAGGDMAAALWDCAAAAAPPPPAAPQQQRRPSLVGAGAGAAAGGELRPLGRLRGRRAPVAGGAAAFDPASGLVVGGHADGTLTAWHAAADAGGA